MKKIIILTFWVLSLPHLSRADELQDLKAKKISDFFIYTAHNLIDDLRTKTAAIHYDSKSISLTQLEEVLNSSTVEVQYNDLVDNTGSIVDAIGTPFKVILDGNSWREFLKIKKDIRLLVLHELLRMAKINDDDFRYSLKYLPTFISDEKITPYCNLRVQTTKAKFESREFEGEGYGTPPAGASFTFSADSPSAKEAENNALKDMREKCNKKGYSEEEIQILSAGLSMQSRSVNGFSTKVTMVDMVGVCYKKVIEKRSYEEQKNEICQKVSLCQAIQKENNTIESDELNLIKQLVNKWDCQ